MIQKPHKLAIGLLFSFLVASATNYCFAAHGSADKKKSIQMEQDRSIYELQPLRLGYERTGVHLDLVLQGMAGLPMQGWEHIALFDGKQTVVLTQLNQLRGYVHIPDGKAALRYVRLLTAPQTWLLWKHGVQQAELVEAIDAPKLPNFGLARVMNSSGMLLGGIAHDTYHAAGFTPATVQPVAGGFWVTRWLYVDDRRKRPGRQMVQRVREFVGVDGEYKRTVLQSMPPPDIGLSFPSFK